MKKNNGVLSIIVILLIIIIGIMAYLLLKANKEKSDIISKVDYTNSKINEQKKVDNAISENVNTTGNENKNETKDRSFSDLMNLLYIKDKAKNQDDNILYNYVYDYNDNYSGFEGKDIKAISVIDKEISLVNKDGVNTEKEVKGIDEEVVSVKIGKGEGEIRGIAFLTRNGNVYYLDTDSIIDNKYEAKKIPNLSQVLKIDEVFIAADEETEGEKNLVAVTYDGSYVSIGQ